MTYAANFRCSYVPYPIPTIGKVEGGLTTLSRYMTAGRVRDRAARLPLMAGTCGTAEALPAGGTCSAGGLVIRTGAGESASGGYADGAGKEAQTKVLFDFLQGEYEKRKLLYRRRRL